MIFSWKSLGEGISLCDPCKIWRHRLWDSRSFHAHKLRDPETCSEVAWMIDIEQAFESFSNNYYQLLGYGNGRNRIRIQRSADSAYFIELCWGRCVYRPIAKSDFSDHHQKFNGAEIRLHRCKSLPFKIFLTWWTSIERKSLVRHELRTTISIFYRKSGWIIFNPLGSNIVKNCRR